MINLQNVSKTYVSKSKNKVEALKEANFTIGDSGMTFILGKSGSGKSTLLNLLGGLDRPTSGEIVVDGVSMSNFTQGDYDGYRNGYVGFVFQEYNLLDDFNVQDNVAIALQLSKDSDVEQKVISALEQVELNKEYLKRRIGELSGGEKQRVAIARAIIKDSKMILADEPTGNLDSATGESVWNILKNLSKERAVVVVSHDRDSALKYSDRIIEIADGVVIADNGSITNTEPQRTFTPTKQRLPFKVCLKMGLNNLLKRKGKTVSVILVSIFTILALLASQLCLTYMPERALAKHVKKNNVPYITVYQGGTEGADETRGECFVMRSQTKQYIMQNSQCIQKEGCISGKQDILDMGLTFVGEALELDDESFYVKKSALYRDRGYVEVDGKIVALDAFNHPVSFLVGKKINLGGRDRKFRKLAGVVEDVEDFNLPSYFFLENSDVDRSGIFGVGDSSTLMVDYNGAQYGGKFSVGDHARGRVLTADGLRDNQVEINDGEVIINFLLYQELFNKTASDFIDFEENEVKAVPPEIGQKVSIKLRDRKTDEIMIDLGELTLKGIELDTDAWFGAQIYVSDMALKKATLKSAINGYIIKVDSVQNISRFLSKLRGTYGGRVEFAGYVINENDKKIDMAYTLELLEWQLDMYAVIFGIVAIILLVVLLLMVINLISFSITQRKREIGILSAIGASNWDIIKIFIVETLVISVITFVIGLCGMLGAVLIFNLAFSKAHKFMSIASIFVVDPYALITLAVASFGLLLLAALLPTIKIARSKPIDAIRNV